MIDFELDPEFREKVEWTKAFVEEKIAPLDALWPNPTAPQNRSIVAARKIVSALQAEVKAQGLWAAHRGKWGKHRFRNHSMIRNSPSCAQLAIRLPSRWKKLPREKPRPFPAHGDRIEKSSQSSRLTSR